MISIITCSKEPNISETLSNNIRETIGLDYELIVINNSTNKYSICAAYNEGVRQAHGEILCFLHTDILFETHNWGIKVTNIFKDESIGCIGIIGSHYLQKKLGYWDMMVPYTTGYVPVTLDKKYKVDMNIYQNNNSEVVAIDGMWFCIKKTTFNDIKFDSDTFKDFHFYDMDICMQILNLNKKIIIARDLVIYHLCHPQYNETFIKNMELFFSKWDKFLPIYRGIDIDPITTKQIYYWSDRLCTQYKQFIQLTNRHKDKTNELKDLQSSWKYKIGKFILIPFSWIHKKIKIIKK